MDDRRPPRHAERLLEALLPPGARDAVLGDLEESFRDRPSGISSVVWYWSQALLLGSVMGGLRLPRWCRTALRREELSRELGFAVRGLLRRPVYALLVMATIALGVGSVTAGFGLLHEVVLRPLPFDDPERLVAVRTVFDADILGVTEPEYLAIAEHAEAFESVAALVEPNLDTDWTWSVRGERRPLDAVRVTDGFFRTLGVSPEIGTLSAAGTPGERRVVVSRAFWRGELGGDPSALGGVLRVNGEPYVVSGVLPASFELPLGPEPTDVWILYAPEPVEARVDLPLAFRVVGRLAPGVDEDRAVAEVTRLVEDRRAMISDTPRHLLVRPLAEDLVGADRRPLVLLALAGTLVLLVASLNLSFLIGARSVERREELSVRTALGASRGRLLRHLLAEAALLALVGGTIAVGLAASVLDRVFEARPGGLVRATGAEVGPEIVLVGLAAALVPALVAALFPALRIAAGTRTLGARGSSTDRTTRGLSRLVSTVESGAVFALLVVAALVIRSLQEVTAVEPGFDTTSTVGLTVFLPPDRYSFEARETASALLLAMEERIEALPGVHAAGTISNLPLSPESWSGTLVIEGRGELDDEVVDWELISPGYLEAIGIPLLRGRAFDERDRGDGDRVALINETMAGRWWPDGDPIGARISGGGAPSTVVGVVGDVKQQGLHTGTRGFMYLPMLQTGAPSKQELVVRVEGDGPEAAVGRIRAVLSELEPDLAVGPVRTLDMLVKDSSGPFRLRAVLLGTFAAMALLLGMAGIYGVTAHGVRTRHRDLGIRIALGADGGRIMKDVLSEALLPVVWGLCGGLVVVLAAGPALGGLLYGVSPTDARPLMGIGLLLLASGGAAVLPSAVRARRIDPAGMLRGE